ncbi:MAG: hypothetical protein ACRDYB_02240 [Acidimicrobiales bacterium]
MTPRPPGGAHGNSATAERWAAILTGLGHPVELVPAYRGRPADLLVALHARRSCESLWRFREVNPRAPAVLALTRTDLYPELTDADRPALELADRLVVLQPLGLAQLPAHLRSRAAVIYQSAAPLPPRASAPSVTFDVVLLANLRRAKDPLLAARAARPRSLVDPGAPRRGLPRSPPGAPSRARGDGQSPL